ncbi:hypothetical protein BC832DRAFT_283098 [Gaertneriomyces semiglobifer]|nr:hypothetical protein BC832DRAFT_283098 [Gaertneriomyces semiglobifer]
MMQLVAECKNVSVKVSPNADQHEDSWPRLSHKGLQGSLQFFNKKKIGILKGYNFKSILIQDWFTSLTNCQIVYKGYNVSKTVKMAWLAAMEDAIKAVENGDCSGLLVLIQHSFHYSLNADGTSINTTTPFYRFLQTELTCQNKIVERYLEILLTFYLRYGPGWVETDFSAMGTATGIADESTQSTGSGNGPENQEEAARIKRIKESTVLTHDWSKSLEFYQSGSRSRSEGLITQLNFALNCFPTEQVGLTNNKTPRKCPKMFGLGVVDNPGVLRTYYLAVSGQAFLAENDPQKDGRGGNALAKLAHDILNQWRDRIVAAWKIAGETSKIHVKVLLPDYVFEGRLTLDAFGGFQRALFDVLMDLKSAKEEISKLQQSFFVIAKERIEGLSNICIEKVWREEK